LGVAASNVVTDFLRFYGEKFEFPNFLVDNVKALPWPPLTKDDKAAVERLVTVEVSGRREAYQQHEPFLEFTAPTLLWRSGRSDALSYDPRSLLGAKLEHAVATAYGLTEPDREDLDRDLSEAIEVRVGHAATPDQGEDEDQDNDDQRDFVLPTDQRSQYEAFISYSIGCSFGRWDARIGCDASLAPRMAGPFDPLPACSPGALLGPDGRYATSRHIVSVEWLQARPDAITLPPEGAVGRSTIIDAEYPVNVAWDGVLVDDVDHPSDVVARIRAVANLLLTDRAEAVEREVCEMLGVNELRQYFRNPRGFWEDHVKRYSKSRRKAPIYWLLQSNKRSYGLWLYYHRLDGDILFKGLTNYVEPKIQLEDGRLRDLRARRAQVGGSGGAARHVDREIERQELLLAELNDFREKLHRVALLGLQPDLDDGVVLNAAPLWELMPWKVAKDYWEELLQGKYEWSSIGKQLRAKGLVR
jgi:hypothetical protein